jgi:predicted NUDIX family phosphoesterase
MSIKDIIINSRNIELNEELELDNLSLPYFNPIKIIQESNTPVNSVHLGLVELVIYSSKISLKENKLTNLEKVPLHKLKESKENYEEWSNIAIDRIIDIWS